MDLTRQDDRGLMLNAFTALRVQSDETRSNLHKSIVVSKKQLADNAHLRPYLTEYVRLSVPH
jgi:hypothetical protein